MMKLEIKVYGYKTVIIAEYGPTNDSTVVIQDEFKSHLTALLNCIGNRKEIILM